MNLAGEDLDAAIAALEGVPLPFAPSRCWAHGGPLIERERIDVEHCDKHGGLWTDLDEIPDECDWRATIDTRHGVQFAYGATPLEAAMRALLVRARR